VALLNDLSLDWGPKTPIQGPSKSRKQGKISPSFPKTALSAIFSQGNLKPSSFLAKVREEGIGTEMKDDQIKNWFSNETRRQKVIKRK
jgi:hypothetical protein